MDMPFDKGRHDKLAVKVDNDGIDGAFTRRRRLAGRRDGTKAAAGDSEIRQQPISQFRVVKDRLFAQNRLSPMGAIPAESASPRRPPATGQCGSNEKLFHEIAAGACSSEAERESALRLLPIPLSRKFPRPRNVPLCYRGGTSRPG
ncbi:hypothetical protein MesoLj113a_31930 [Mesorhizobium sp. 113-1-2]|nr:hypothetical protein Gll2204 [Mesorhizobium loti]BCG72035.1 hypothetical protein MesoLj113a_31930 [Mesorhizobium sp. 113-1-2]